MNADMLWQLFDTSAKVGIGALISALFMIVILHRRPPNNKVSAHPDQRRLMILEGISADVGHLSHVFAKYSALVIEAIHYGKHWPDARKKELDMINHELVREFKKLSDAESKLLMLGERVLEKTLRLYGSKIANFRRQVYVGRTDMKDETIIAMKKDINFLREQFYDFLSKKYDRLLTGTMAAK
ncbi:MAG: hypothetical protein ACI9D5_002485 [Candidatus Endobugula sp.]|jgi:hypothetical protein